MDHFSRSKTTGGGDIRRIRWRQQANKVEKTGDKGEIEREVETSGFPGVEEERGLRKEVGEVEIL